MSFFQKVSFLLFFCLSPGTFIFCQAPDTLWTKSYGQSGFVHEVGTAVTATADGGYMVAGYLDYAQNDIWLLKTDRFGDTLWTRRIDGYGHNDRAFDIKTVTQGGYIVTGYTVTKIHWYGGSDYVPETEIWLVRLNDQGDTLWTKTFGQIDNFVGYGDIGYSVLEANDGGFVIAGEYSWVMVVIKTDANGQLIWEKQFGNSSCCPDEAAYGIAATADGGYIVTGSLYTGSSTDYDLALLRLDSLGNTLWSKRFDADAYDDIGKSVQPMPDGGFMVTGNSIFKGWNNELHVQRWVLRTNADGDTLWTKKFRDIAKDQEANAVLVSTHHTLVITGKSQGLYGHNLLYIGSLNYAGEVLWEKTIDSDGLPDNIGYDIAETPDSGYIVTGKYSRDIGVEGSNLWLVKLTAEETQPQALLSRLTPLSVQFDIYPNPSLRSARIDLYLGEENQTLNLTLFDIRGRRIKTLFEGNLLPNHTTRLPWDGGDANRKEISPGIYLLQAKTEKQQMTRRLTIIR